MNVDLFLWHLAAVLLAALALWSMRYEFTEKPATRLDWALPPVLAVVVAAVLLIVSPGKRTELWTVAIYAGLAIGLGVGVILKVDQDFAQKLVRVRRTWDGVIAAALMLLAALARFVSSDLMGRQSAKYGILCGAAGFLAAYLCGRVITLRYYKARQSKHINMVRGEKPKID